MVLDQHKKQSRALRVFEMMRVQYLMDHVIKQFSLPWQRRLLRQLQKSGSEPKKLLFLHPVNQDSYIRVMIKTKDYDFYVILAPVHLKCKKK